MGNGKDLSRTLKAILMNPTEKLFLELEFTHRIYDFSKIDQFKKQDPGLAKKQYKGIDDFKCQALNLDMNELSELRKKYSFIYTFYKKYGQNRPEFFKNPEAFVLWYEEQNNQCHYCDTTQINLNKIVEKRGGNLTYNDGTKRASGSLEIEKLNPSKGYTLDNSVLACPFCNNAKSNLIKDSDWKKHFADAMKKYLKEQIK